MFAAAGLVWLADLILRKFAGPAWTEKLLSIGILLAVIGACIGILRSSQQEIVVNRGPLPEQFAAQYLVDHIKPEDTILATGPVTIRTAYYASINGVPFDRFYPRDHPVKIQNALVLLRKNSKHNTPQKVLDFFQLTSAFDLSSAKLVFEYGKVQIYSVHAKN